MYKALLHIRPLMLALASLAVLCASTSAAFAQVPSGTNIDNQAGGSFRLKTGARDTIRSNSVRTVVSSTEGPFLVLEKRVDFTTIAPGANLGYTLSLGNQGTSSATSLRITDSLPVNTTFVSAGEGGVLQGSMIVWTLPSLPAAGTFELHLVVRVNPTFVEGEISNRARVSSHEGISAESNLVQSTVNTWIASSLSLVATKGAIIGNGSDTTTLHASIVDAAGVRATDGTQVLFTTTAGGFPNGKDSITVSTLGGTASVALRSDVVTNEIVTANIAATTMSASGRTVRDTGSIAFYSGAIAGRVFSTSTRTPIVGAHAFAYDAAGVEVSRDTTDSDGYYLLPVPDRGEYEVLIRYINRHGNLVETRSVVSVHAPVGSGGTGPTSAHSSIAGTVIDQLTGSPIEEVGIPVTIERIALEKRNSSSVLKTTRLTGAHGAFLFDSLTSGRYRIRIEHEQYQGSIDVVVDVPGLMVIDSDIEASEIPRLQLRLTATKRIADIGDVVGFTLDATNTSKGVHLDHIVVAAALPPGFAFVAGTSRLAGVAIADPSGGHTRFWQLPDTLAPGAELRLTYRVVAAAGAIDGDGTTRVVATATSLSGDSALSARVEAIVDVRPGVFTDRGIIIGKIYYDANRSGDQDDGEEGIPGVELWMEDGTRVVTGEDGRYSLPQVMPGERVVRVNRKTLPTGARLFATGTAFSDDALSRFVRITEGGIARADFHLLPPTQGALGFSVSHQQLAAYGDTATARFVVRTDDPAATKGILLSDTLPAGLHYDLTSLRVNGVAIKQEGRKSQILALQLHGLARPEGDTVSVTIVADSAGVDRPIGRRGVLILSYPKARDAVFRPSTIESIGSGLEGWVLRYEPRPLFAAADSGRRRRGGSS